MRTIFLSHEIEKQVTLSNAQKQLNEHRKKDAEVLSSIQQAVADTFFFFQELSMQLKQTRHGTPSKKSIEAP